MRIYEISSTQYQQITPLLGKYSNYPVVNAVIEGNSPGQIFVDTLADPKSAFVLTNAGFSYLAGSPKNFEFNNTLKELLDNDLFPKIKESDDPTLIFYPLSDGWEAPIKKMLGQREIHNTFRKQVAFKPEKFTQHSDWEAHIPVGFNLHPIDRALLDKFDADMFPWESPQVFLEKGFGYWLMTDDEIVSECSTVFVGGGAVEINIHTEDKYRKQGFAQLTTSAFIAESLSRGLRPNWECWWNNKPSISLAKKLGFEPIGDHPVFLVELQLKNQCTLAEGVQRRPKQTI